MSRSAAGTIWAEISEREETEQHIATSEKERRFRILMIASPHLPGVAAAAKLQGVVFVGEAT